MPDLRCLLTRKTFPALAALLAFASPGAAWAQTGAAGGFPTEPVPCPTPLQWEGEVEGETYDCGVVTVPENHEEPGGRTLELIYLRLRSTTLSPMPDPMVYLSGGPGGSALHEVETNKILFDNMQPTRARRDVIFYDQRGTGHSQILACGPFNAALGVVGELYPQIDLSQLDANAGEGKEMMLSLALCAAGYQSEGIDLAQYNSISSAQDIAAIVQALGYEGDYNLYGTSYGTQLALNALRSTPDAIRAVVVDGTVSPAMPATAQTHAKIKDHYDTIFRECAANAFCGETFPDLKNRFIAVLSDLEDNPLVFDPPLVPNDIMRYGFGLVERIDPKFFADFGQLNQKARQGGFAGLLPQIIEALEVRDTQAIRKILGGGTMPEHTDPIQPPATGQEVLAADNDYLAPPIALILETAASHTETDRPSLSHDWIGIVLDDMRARLTAGEAQAEVIKDMVDLALLPLKGGEAEVLNTYATDRLGAEKAASAAALVGAMSREDLRETMWDIAGIAAKMSGKNERGGSPGIAMGLMFNINCAEDISLTPIEVAEAYGAASPYQGVFVQTLEEYRRLREACTYFPAPFTKDEIMSPVVSDKPVLIFQEGLDSQTPFTGGAFTLETLENGFLVAWPSEGHVIASRSPDGCAGAIAAAFYDRPSRIPDITCASDPYYTIPFEAYARKLKGEAE